MLLLNLIQELLKILYFLIVSQIRLLVRIIQNDHIIIFDHLRLLHTGFLTFLLPRGTTLGWAILTILLFQSKSPVSTQSGALEKTVNLSVVLNYFLLVIVHKILQTLQGRWLGSIHDVVSKLALLNYFVGLAITGKSFEDEVGASSGWVLGQRVSRQDVFLTSIDLVFGFNTYFTRVFLSTRVFVT